MKGKKSSFWQDFKAFAMRGNVVDMAVGVVVGGAFSKIVSSLVNDLIMPTFSVLIGSQSVASLAWTFPANIEGGEPIVIGYGAFIQNIIDFLLIALCVFCAVRLIGRFKRTKEEPSAPPAPPEPSKEEVLLGEIRDLLKEQQSR